MIEAGKKLPLADIGSGVYPTTIFFNHSCEPNTVRINQGPRVSSPSKLQGLKRIRSSSPEQVIFIAKRHIAAGEEVTDCYGIHHLSIPRTERLAALVSLLLTYF